MKESTTLTHVAFGSRRRADTSAALRTACLCICVRNKITVSATTQFSTYQLIDVAFAREEGLTQQQLGEHTPIRPRVDRHSVVGAPENEFWRAVVPRTDICDVVFSC